jgi:hypothetical protein
MHGKLKEQQQDDRTTTRQRSSSPLWSVSTTYVSSEKTQEIAVTVAGGTMLNIKQVGTIYFEDTATKSGMVLKEYHYVPGLSKEMLSLGKLINDGWKPKFTTKETHLQKGEAQILCKQNNTDGMYYLLGKQVETNEVHLVETSEQGGTWKDETEDIIDEKGNITSKEVQKLTTIDINEAHNRMGHNGEALIKKIPQNNRMQSDWNTCKLRRLCIL